MNNIINSEVLETLKKFQNGYDKRNLDKVDEFVEDLFSTDDDVIIIGTGDGEFCKGQSEIKELIQIDWEYWGNFKLNLDNVIISNYGEVAWVVCDGILNKPLKIDAAYDHCMSRVEKIFSAEDSKNNKLLKAQKLISYYLHECSVGDEIGRPVRLTGVLKKTENKWLFSNLHFSYPVAPPTDIKVHNT